MKYAFNVVAEFFFPQNTMFTLSYFSYFFNVAIFFFMFQMFCFDVGTEYPIHGMSRH